MPVRSFALTAFMFIALFSSASLAAADLGSCRDGKSRREDREYRSDITGCKANCELRGEDCIESRRYLYGPFGIRLAESGIACFCTRLGHYYPKKDKEPFPPTLIGAVINDPGLESVTKLADELADEPADSSMAALVITVNRRCDLE